MSEAKQRQRTSGAKFKESLQATIRRGRQDLAAIDIAEILTEETRALLHLIATNFAGEEEGDRVIAHVGHVDPSDSQSPYRPGWPMVFVVDRSQDDDIPL